MFKNLDRACSTRLLRSRSSKSDKDSICHNKYEITGKNLSQIIQSCEINFFSLIKPRKPHKNGSKTSLRVPIHISHHHLSPHPILTSIIFGLYHKHSSSGSDKLGLRHDQSHVLDINVIVFGPDWQFNGGERCHAPTKPTLVSKTGGNIKSLAKIDEIWISRGHWIVVNLDIFTVS